MDAKPVTRAREWAAGAGTIGLIGVVMVWIVSGATWIHWPTARHDFSQLAASFLHGQLSLLEKPSPELLALADPYDPIANARYRAHDEVLFRGKYYEYWGPGPAILIAGGCWVIGVSTPTFGDQYPAAIFLFGVVVLATGMIFHLRARYFPGQRVSTGLLAALSLGLSAPVLYTATRLAVYEGAIAAGQFFLLGGLYAAWIAVTGKRPRPWLLGAAGICWAMACASRVSLPPAVAVLTAATVWKVWRMGRWTGTPEDPHPNPLPEYRARGKCVEIAALVAPLVAGAVMLAWYNQARFGSVTEFGLRYQLSGQRQLAPRASGFISVRNAAPALASYLFTPPGTARSFPYLFILEGRPWLTTWFHLPAGFRSEPMAGLVWTQPFLIFALVGMVAAVKQKQPGPRWLVGCLGAGGVLSFAPVLAVKGTTMRYLIDGLPCLSVLAAVGLWQTLEYLGGKGRWAREVRAAVRLIVVYQCVVGLLLAISDQPALAQALHWYFPTLRL